MRLLTSADYRHIPWRNGGGTTTEILVEPSGVDAAKEPFHYRVSIADVVSDGPFSRFDGYDRHIMLLSGAGMTIDCGEHGRIDLVDPLVPHAFSGDWEVQGSLIDGPVRDFNVIALRAKTSSSLAAHVLTGPERLTFGPSTWCVVHVIDGALVDAGQGDTLVANASIELVPRGTARIAIAQITMR